ncbi:thioredoxin-like protein [Trametopsis cervina]|nr:thioredoxin-like protein [Trametopsis cervina]
MHFVTAYPDRRLNEADGKINVVGLGEVEVDGSQPVDLRVYAPDGKDEWQQYVTTLRDQRPLILFSKSYCQFSRRAKALFQSLQVSPAPHVVELDLRSDGHIIQSILRRITGRATVPNVLLQGNSIGGSDDIQELHAKGQLRAMLQEGGLTLKG